MAKNEIVFGKHEIIDDKRWRITNRTVWDAYNNAKTITIDSSKMYLFTAVNSGNMDLEYTITNNVLYKDVSTQGSYPLNVSISGNSLIVASQGQAYTACHLYEFTKVSVE